MWSPRYTNNWEDGGDGSVYLLSPVRSEASSLNNSFGLSPARSLRSASLLASPMGVIPVTIVEDEEDQEDEEMIDIVIEEGTGAVELRTLEIETDLEVSGGAGEAPRNSHGNTLGGLEEIPKSLVSEQTPRNPVTEPFLEPSPQPVAPEASLEATLETDAMEPGPVLDAVAPEACLTLGSDAVQTETPRKTAFVSDNITPHEISLEVYVAPNEVVAIVEAPVQAPVISAPVEQSSTDQFLSPFQSEPGPLEFTSFDNTPLISSVVVELSTLVEVASGLGLSFDDAPSSTGSSEEIPTEPEAAVPLLLISNVRWTNRRLSIPIEPAVVGIPSIGRVPSFATSDAETCDQKLPQAKSSTKGAIRPFRLTHAPLWSH